MTYTYTFGVKDYNKTASKWLNYKADKYKELTNNERAQGQIEWHLKKLVFEVTELTICEPMVQRIIDDIREAKENNKPYKAMLNQIKTTVNHITRQANSGLMDWLGNNDLTEREANNFAITFYLNNYEAINNKMSEVMTDIQESYL